MREQLDLHDKVVERDDQPVPAHRDLDGTDVEVELVFGEHVHVVLHVPSGDLQLAFGLDLVGPADALHRVDVAFRVFELVEHGFLVVDHNHFRVYEDIDQELSPHLVR